MFSPIVHELLYVRGIVQRIIVIQSFNLVWQIISMYDKTSHTNAVQKFVVKINLLYPDYHVI